MSAEMWGVFDAEDEGAPPIAVFLVEEEARGYVLMCCSGCFQARIDKCKVDVTVNESGGGVSCRRCGYSATHCYGCVEKGLPAQGTRETDALRAQLAAVTKERDEYELSSDSAAMEAQELVKERDALQARVVALEAAVLHIAHCPDCGEGTCPCAEADDDARAGYNSAHGLDAKEGERG